MNDRLYKTYTAGLVMTSPGSFSIKTWKQVCGWVGWPPLRFYGCVHLPVTKNNPPTFTWNPGVPNVSLVEIGPFFDQGLFNPGDNAHLNNLGYEVHSRYLLNGLRARCWW